MNLIQNRLMSVSLYFVLAALSILLIAPTSSAKPPKAPERAEVIMIGDRLVDIAYNLGVLPAAMSVRCSMWPLCKQLNKAVQVLGCPNCLLKKEATPVLKAVQNMNIDRIIIEKHPHFCNYKDVSPEDIVSFLKGKGLVIEYVDFSDGLKKAIQQTAELLGRPAKGKSLIQDYKKQMSKVKKNLDPSSKGLKVVILNGTYQKKTGRIMLRAEAPGGYADQFLLKPLGCQNKGDAFQNAGEKPSKGHYMVKKSRQGLMLKPLVKAAPDLIAATGNAFAVQKAIVNARKYTPGLAEVPAVKNNKIYSLPAYIDASVIEYPEILSLWAQALEQ